MNIFNRRAVRLHRDRSALNLTEFDFLFREVSERLGDRLLDVMRTFPVALDLGCHGGELAAQVPDKSGIENLIHCDLSPAMARRAQTRTGNVSISGDEELLPIREQSLDLVLSNLSLHWVNDLPGALTQIRRTLKPDGLFLAALLGGDTLHELRDALVSAEIEMEGGISPRTSPMAEVKDAGNLLSRAGFALPVADTEKLTVSYDHPLKLMADLRGMGEANATALRRTGFTRRATLMRAVDIYQEKYAHEDGRIPATFEIIYLTAWAPHESQQKPLQPGSGKVSLSNVFMGDDAKE